jgi:signal recognition particle receptor subunit beta
MTFLNHMSREMNCKIVYYGPGLCGKTANLQYIHDRTAPAARGKMISLATESDRTLFFDFMPLELGKIGEYKIRLHLYTVPGLRRRLAARPARRQRREPGRSGREPHRV